MGGLWQAEGKVEIWGVARSGEALPIMKNAESHTNQNLKILKYFTQYSIVFLLF